MLLALLPGALVVYLSVRGGGYDSLVQQEIAIAIWYAVFIALAFKLFPREGQHRLTWITGLLVASFAGWIGLSMLWTDSPDATFREFGLALLYLGVFALTALAQSRRSLGWWLASLTAGLAAVTALAALSRMVPGPFPASDVERFLPDATARLSYPLGYWNAVGFIAACNVPLLLHATATARRRALRLLAAAWLPLTGLTLYLTFSRGATVAAVAAALLYVALSPQRQRVLLPFAAGAAGTVLLALRVRSSPELADGLTGTSAARSQGAWLLIATLLTGVAVAVAIWLVERRPISLPRLRGVPLRIGRRARVAVALATALIVLAGVAGTGAIGDGWSRFKDPQVAYSDQPGAIGERLTSASSHGRYQYWETSVDAFGSNPIVGSGAGTWEFWWSRLGTFDDFVRNSHSLVMDVLPELGAIGLVLLLAMLGWPFWVAATRYRSADAAARGTIAALVAVVLVFTISVAVDWTWKMPAVGVVYFIVLGMLAGSTLATRSTGAAARAPQVLQRTPAYGAGVIVVAVAWAAVVAQAIPMLSERKVRESQAQVRALDYEKALGPAQTAVTLEPWAAGPKLQLALLHQLRKEPTPAVQRAREAVEAEPVNWRNWVALSEIYFWAGQDQNGDLALRQALELDPISPELRRRVDALPSSQATGG